MNYSISNSTPFSAINWNNYENRPVINERSRFCSDSQQDNPRAKCCMDGYSIEAVLDEIAQSPERDFLSGYPCVNGMELSGLADRAGFVDEFNEAVPAKTQPPQYSCDPKTIQALQRLVEALPVKLGDVTSALPDLCKAAVGLITNFRK